MEKREFRDICDKEFKFLIDRFNYKFDSLKEEREIINVIYKSNAIGITIQLDRREIHVFLFLHFLIKGEIPNYPVFINPDTMLNTFDFGDLLVLRNATKEEIRSIKKQFDKRKDVFSIEKVLRNYAVLLQKYASDILKGDFSVLSELDKIVKRRIKKQQNNSRYTTLNN